MRESLVKFFHVSLKSDELTGLVTENMDDLVVPTPYILHFLRGQRWHLYDHLNIVVRPFLAAEVGDTKASYEPAKLGPGPVCSDSNSTMTHGPFATAVPETAVVAFSNCILKLRAARLNAGIRR